MRQVPLLTTNVSCADGSAMTRKQFMVTVTVSGWNLEAATDIVVEDAARSPHFPRHGGDLDLSEASLVNDLIGPEQQYGYLVSVDDDSIVAMVDAGAAARDDASLRECLKAVGEVTSHVPSVRLASLFAPTFELSEASLRDTLRSMTTKAVPSGGAPAAGRVEFDMSRESPASSFSVGAPRDTPTAPPFVPHDGDLIDAQRQRLFLGYSLSFSADKTNKSSRLRGTASSKASVIDGERWLYFLVAAGSPFTSQVLAVCLFARTIRRML